MPDLPRLSLYDPVEFDISGRIFRGVIARLVYDGHGNGALTLKDVTEIVAPTPPAADLDIPDNLADLLGPPPEWKAPAGFPCEWLHDAGFRRWLWLREQRGKGTAS